MKNNNKNKNNNKYYNNNYLLILLLLLLLLQQQQLQQQYATKKKKNNLYILKNAPTKKNIYIENLFSSSISILCKSIQKRNSKTNHENASIETIYIYSSYIYINIKIYICQTLHLGRTKHHNKKIPKLADKIKKKKKTKINCLTVSVSLSLSLFIYIHIYIYYIIYIS